MCGKVVPCCLYICFLCLLGVSFLQLFVLSNSGVFLFILSHCILLQFFKNIFVFNERQKDIDLNG